MFCPKICYSTVEHGGTKTGSRPGNVIHVNRKPCAPEQHRGNRLIQNQQQNFSLQNMMFTPAVVFDSGPALSRDENRQRGLQLSWKPDFLCALGWIHLASKPRRHLAVVGFVLHFFIVLLSRRRTSVSVTSHHAHFTVSTAASYKTFFEHSDFCLSLQQQRCPPWSGTALKHGTTQIPRNVWAALRNTLIL